MNIYAISGLGADERVFEFLSLDHPIHCLHWISPKKNERIEVYAKRLAEKVDTSEPFVLMGLSFGGFMATEISKLLKPELTILISTAEVRSDIPFAFRMIGTLKLVNFIPSSWFKPPKRLMHYLFQTKRTKLLDAILDDMDPDFTKWSVKTLVNWNNKTRVEPRFHISGSDDLLLPPHNNPSIKVLKNTGHFMVVDKADEVSEIINSELRKL